MTDIETVDYAKAWDIHNVTTYLHFCGMEISRRGRIIALGRAQAPTTPEGPKTKAVALIFQQVNASSAPFLQVRLSSEESQAYKFAAFPSLTSDNPVVLLRDDSDDASLQPWASTLDFIDISSIST